MSDVSNQQPESFNLNSDEVAARKRADLKRLFPEVFNEDKIDLEQLRRVMGDWVDEGTERFGLTWPGKAACMKVIQAPATGALRPDRDKSVNFDESENIFIEGDNLEVLKLLQKAYFGKIKSVYIDPPYNTGREFIYPDKFSENLETYLAYTNQASADGRRFSTNTESDGRFHSRWLNMMYSRLYLAKNLMADDGIIFCSIDDHEQSNLKTLLDQIFGEENFVANIIWQKVFSPKNTAQYFSEDHEYVIAYAKNKEVWKPKLLPRSDENIARYTNQDEDERGPWLSGAMQARNYYSKGEYEVTSPSGKKFRNPKGTYWRFSKERFDELDADNRIWWGEDGGNVPRLKRFLSEVKDGVVPQTLWFYGDVGHSQEAKEEFNRLIPFENNDNVLNSVKPSRLIEKLVQISTDEGDIVLDFFAGSGVTGQAVMRRNHSDGKRRKFIMVQLPEPLNSEEAKFKTLADFARARITNAPINEGYDEAGDNGFRSFKLTETAFSNWSAQSSDSTADLLTMLERHATNIGDAKDEDILFELLLKDGFELTTKVDEVALAGCKVFSVADSALLICLDRNLTKEIIDALADLAEEKDTARVVCLDAGFQGNDQLKTNAVQTFKSRLGHGEDGSVFRTV